MTIEFDPGVIQFITKGCPEGEGGGSFFIASPAKIIEYNNLNIPSTQIWQATFDTGNTFNVTLRIINSFVYYFQIRFVDGCIDTDLLTLPVILTTTVF